MRVGMGLIKNEHGVFHVRRKVPKALEVATARAMGVPKERVSWLKETLGTKDEKQAKVLAKPVMMKFDRILAQAEALLVEHPMRTELTDAEIKRIADYFYAHELGGDEALREDGIGSDPIFASVHRQLVDAGIEFETPFEVAEETGSGLSARMMHKIEEDASSVLSAAKGALARGNVNFIRYELNELLQLFRINLDPACADYRKVALAVIKAGVRRLIARNCLSPAAQPQCRVVPCVPPTKAGTKWKLVQSLHEWSSRAGLTTLSSCTVTWRSLRSTGSMFASFAMLRNLFQSNEQGSSEKQLCQNLQNGRASIPVRSASVQPPSTNG